MTETGAVVSSLGLRPGPENALGKALLQRGVHDKRLGVITAVHPSLTPLLRG